LTDSSGRATSSIKFAGKYHFKPRDIQAAMDQVDDALGDLYYEYKEELTDELSERDRRLG
jgi:hypothetical protein